MRRKILDQKGLNFLTMTIAGWIDLFTRKVYCDIIIDSLEYCRKEKGLLVYGYVIMPSHLHLILQASGEKQLSEIIKEFKSYTARCILNYITDKSKPESRREWLLQYFSNYAKTSKVNRTHKIWQKGNHPTELYSPQVIRRKLIYIHNNPVVAGMVNSPEHYRYSSASNYTNTYSVNGCYNQPLEVDIFGGG